MNIQARYNLQHGVKENKLFPHTDYTATSSLDRYIIAKIENRNKARAIIDSRNLERAEMGIIKDVESKLDKMLKRFEK